MSQMDSTKETIGDYEFEIFKLDPLKSLEALNVVKEVVAPALGEALGAIESLADLADLSKLLDDPKGGGKLGGALERLLMSASYGRQKFLIDTFRPVTHVDGKEIGAGEFALIFRGDVPLMIKWLALCFRAEWGNVVGALSDAIGGALKQTEQPPKSPST